MAVVVVAAVVVVVVEEEEEVGDLLAALQILLLRVAGLARVSRPSALPRHTQHCSSDRLTQHCGSEKPQQTLKSNQHKRPQTRYASSVCGIQAPAAHLTRATQYKNPNCLNLLTKGQIFS